MKKYIVRVVVFLVLLPTAFVFLNLRFRSSGPTESSDITFERQAPESLSINNYFKSLNLDNCSSKTKQVTSYKMRSYPDEGYGDVVFRYRTYLSGRPDWVTRAHTNLNLTSSDSASVTKYNRGWLFDDIWVTNFNRNYYLGNNPINPGANITIQAWFKTDSSDSYQTLFSNTEGGGFSLKIKNGKLRGLFRIKSDARSYESLIVNGDTDVSDGKWHHATFVVKRINSEQKHKLCLYLDDSKEGCETFVRSKLFKKSNYRPSVGSEPNYNGKRYTHTHFFNGQIYAVTVHNYAVHEGHLRGRTVRDGSRYFNMPSFHDYISGKDSNDLRLKKTLLNDSFKFSKSIIKERFSIPYQDDYYVPQGISIEGGSIYLSLYYNNTHEESGCEKENNNSEKYPSIIVEIDRCTSKIKNTFALYKGSFSSPNTGHVGGVAVVKNDGYTYAFIPSGSGLYRYELEVPKGGDSSHIQKIIPTSGAPKSMLNTQGVIKEILYSEVLDYNVPMCGSAYLSYDKYRNYLWIGDFDDEKKKWICAFELSDDKKRIEAFQSELKRLPVKKVQGAAVRGDGKFLLSTSYGNDQSKIYLWDLESNEHELFLTGPPGFEDISISSDGVAFTSSESGAKFYQKRGNNSACSSSWSGYFPYIFGFNANE